MINIYSRKGCSPCNTLKTILNKKNIPYKVLDLDDNPELEKELIDKTGRLLIPTVVSDKGIVSGFNLSAIYSLI